MSASLNTAELLEHMEKDAKALTNAALGISRAIAEKNQQDMNAFLMMNLEIWTAIRVVMQRDEGTVPQETRDNLLKLNQYVVKTTHDLFQDMQESAAETLININLQLAEGLLENIAGAKETQK